MLHNGKVGVEISWPTKTVSALRERDGGAVAYAGHSQVPDIEPCFASGLNESRVWIRNAAAVRLHKELRRLTRLQIQGERSSFAAGRPIRKRASGNRIDLSEIVILL